MPDVYNSPVSDALNVNEFLNSEMSKKNNNLMMSPKKVNFMENLVIGTPELRPANYSSILVNSPTSAIRVVREESGTKSTQKSPLKSIRKLPSVLRSNHG